MNFSYYALALEGIRFSSPISFSARSTQSDIYFSGLSVKKTQSFLNSPVTGNSFYSFFGGIFRHILSSAIVLKAINYDNKVYIEKRRIMLSDSEILIKKCSFFRCISVGYGGALLIDTDKIPDSKVSIELSTFDNCYAKSSGTFYISSCFSVINHCCIDRSSSWNILQVAYIKSFNNRSSLIINNTIISRFGFGIACQATTMIIQINCFYVSLSNFSKGRVPQGSGYMICRSVIPSHVEYTSFNDNSVSFGFVYASFSPFGISHCSIINNTYEMELFRISQAYCPNIIIATSCTFSDNKYKHNTTYKTPYQKPMNISFNNCLMLDSPNDIVSTNFFTYAVSGSPFIVYSSHSDKYLCLPEPTTNSPSGPHNFSIFYTFILYTIIIVILIAAISCSCYQHRHSGYLDSWLSKEMILLGDDQNNQPQFNKE